MNFSTVKTLTLFMLFVTTKSIWAQQQPNVLWLLTDDQRYDSVKAFNQMLHGRDESELGYVESPNVDKLAAQGTTFINTYCQAPGCAPSRASMHLGRYPFRSGVYEFEYHHNKAAHSKPSLPEQMESLGYQTLHIGKLGVRLKTINNKGKSVPHEMYQQDISFKQLRQDGLTDWGKDWFYSLDGKKLEKPLKSMVFFVDPEGKFSYVSKELEKDYPKYRGSAKKTNKKYDILPLYNDKKPKTDFSAPILGGVSPQPAGKTRDGYYASLFEDYLKNQGKEFKAGSRTFNGVDSSKPLFCHIGFDFPHTPVLPPADYRARFKKHRYKIPEFNEKEFKTMAKQMKKQVTKSYTDHFTDKEKQTMVQDYYAFCAYGDRLIGQATDAFIKYSEQKKQPWMIVYVCGDHGWKLNDHGSVSKFSPWDMDIHNPIIVVSSDKKKFPAGKVVKNYTEFVDIAPTIIGAAGGDLASQEFDYLDGLDLENVVSEKAPKRDYIVGECHAVTGPRAFIRTKDYAFSMQIRPDKIRGKDIKWAKNASYQELDPALYDMKKDPKEVNNVAYDKSYATIAKKLRKKLTDIVLGDNRVEVNWGKGSRVTGTKITRSNFAKGAHNYKLKL